MKALAVDLGGSHAACAVVADREVVAVETVSLEAAHGLAGALPVIAEALKRAASSAGVPASACAGLAFGFCGLVDTVAGRVLSTNAKYDDAPGLDLPGWCRESFGLPVPDRERRAPRAPRRAPRRGGAAARTTR